MTLVLRRKQPYEAETDVLTSRMDVVVAQVTKQATARAERRILWARRQAADLCCLAEDELELIQAHAAKPNGFRLVREYRALKRLHTFACNFAPIVEGFLQEHSALVAASVRTTLQSFPTWLAERLDTLEGDYRSFLEQCEADLANSSEYQKQINQDWSVADADGILRLSISRCSLESRHGTSQTKCPFTVRVDRSAYDTETRARGAC